MKKQTGRLKITPQGGNLIIVKMGTVGLIIIFYNDEAWGSKTV
jgi:hypothetical protein